MQDPIFSVQSFTNHISAVFIDGKPEWQEQSNSDGKEENF